MAEKAAVAMAMITKTTLKCMLATAMSGFHLVLRTIESSDQHHRPARR